MVSLEFFPVGDFPLPNGTVKCPAGVDTGCEGDMYEACLLQVACGGVSCADEKQQLALADVLECFEGQHGSVLKTASRCAAAAGFDTNAVSACYSDATRRASAFQQVQLAAAPSMASAKCFPWIIINGEVASNTPKGGCFGSDARTAPLKAKLCQAAKAEGLPPAAACA